MNEKYLQIISFLNFIMFKQTRMYSIQHERFVYSTLTVQNGRIA